MVYSQKILAVSDKNKCYGCSACAQACHHGAITMATNSEGFLYPQINAEKCISCGACDNICPTNQGDLPLGVYSGRLSNEKDLARCASGGAFTALASTFILNGGVVVASTDSFTINHPHFILIDRVEDLYKVQGSKYFQIDLTVETYKLIRSLLLQKKEVLFCGMPCQVAAVKKVFLRFDTLTTIDIICGGVPSYKLLKQYRTYKEKIYHKHIVNHKFRAKDKNNVYGYQSNLTFEDGSTVHYDDFEDEYTRLFSSGVLLRKSCYHCDFSSELRVGDITIGDYWGIEPSSSFFARKNQGVSVTICNTERGLSLLNKMHGFDKEKITYQQAKKRNRPLNIKAPKRIERLYSIKIMNALPFKIATNLVCYRYLIKSAINKIRLLCQR